MAVAPLSSLPYFLPPQIRFLLLLLTPPQEQGHGWCRSMRSIIEESPCARFVFLHARFKRPRVGKEAVRHLVLSGLVSSFAIALPISESYAVPELDEDVKMAMQVDEINAYSFLYPVELPGKKFSFKWVEFRKPERYSSAAPLSRE